MSEISYREYSEADTFLPASRGKGYASATVAHLSQVILDSGKDFCTLYTDLSNPTSNSIYQRIGYMHRANVVDVEFVGGQ